MLVWGLNILFSSEEVVDDIDDEECLTGAAGSFISGMIIIDLS
jgi:hypothetical protein